MTICAKHSYCRNSCLKLIVLVAQFTQDVVFSAFTGCFVSGLFLEGADWDMEHGCLAKSKPRVPVVELPILKIIPTEARRLRLQVLLLRPQRGQLAY